MKRLCILAAIALLPLSAPAYTNSNVVVGVRGLIVNTNNEIVAPTNAAAIRAANDIASEANATNLWMMFQGMGSTNASNAAVQVATDVSQWNSISNLDSVGAIAHAGQLASYAGENSWATTQTWDFTTASNGADWTYQHGSSWVTNYGVKLNGPPFGYGATNQRVIWAQTQTTYAYRITFVAKSGGLNPNGFVFIPSGVEYTNAANDTNVWTTNTVVITNTAQIGFAHGNIYYSPVYLQSVTIESAGAPTNKVRFGGDLIPDVGGTWDIGSAANPADEVYARHGVWWKWEKFETASTGAASNHTIAVGATNLFICFTNSWRGAGTNWARLTIENY